MTWYLALRIWWPGVVVTYVAFLVALSVAVHRHKLGLANKVDDPSFYYAFGALVAVFWPLMPPAALILGIIAGLHYLVGYVVRKVTRARRTVDMLQKAGKRP